MKNRSALLINSIEDSRFQAKKGPELTQKKFFSTIGAELEPLVHDALYFLKALRGRISECSTVDTLSLGAL